MTPFNRSLGTSAMRVPLMVRSTISGMAKTPSATGTKGTPSQRYSSPNTQRSTPVWGSMPTMPTHRPRAPTMSPFTGALPLSTATMEMPKRPSMKNSGEPNARTMGRSTGMESASTSDPNTPPRSDAI